MKSPDTTSRAGAGRCVERLGVVTQQDGLDTDLSVRQNLETYGHFSGLSRRQSSRRADDVLAFFGLSERAGDEVDHLSGGMKRRLAIARAFMTEPDVIVLDEPTTGLDPQGRNLVWEKLAVLKASGVTILMSTHYMEEAATLCDRIAIMHLGQILDAGTPDELIERHASAEVAQLRMPTTASAGIRAALAATGFAWREVGTVLARSGARRPATPGTADGRRARHLPPRQFGRCISRGGGQRAGRTMKTDAPRLVAGVRWRSVQALWLRHAVALKRIWKVALTWYLVEPAVALVAVGFGIGRLVEEVEGGMRYAVFVAPGIIMASAMIHAIFECSWAVFYRITGGFYETALTAPVTVTELALGDVAWSMTRAVLATLSVGLVAAIFGWITSPWAVGMLLAALLVGMEIGAIGLIFAALSPNTRTRFRWCSRWWRRRCIFSAARFFRSPCCPTFWSLWPGSCR